MSYTLLLADDSLTIRRVVELTFAEEDLTVTTVADGRRAMERIASLHPDVVLADVGMREPGGYDIAAFVKGRDDLAHIPVILLTAAFQPIDEARARAAGCDAVLEKPFELARLVAQVKELLPPLPPREVAARGQTVHEEVFVAVDQAAAGAGAVAAAADVPAVSGAAADGDATQDDAMAAAAAFVRDIGGGAPSLEERFDSIDAGTHRPVPLAPGSEWTSESDGKPMSLDDFFDLIDASARRTSAGVPPALPVPALDGGQAGASLALAGPPPAGAGVEQPNGHADASPSARTLGLDGDTAPNGAEAPDAVTRTFLALLETATLPSSPDLVGRAVRLLLAHPDAAV